MAELNKLNKKSQKRNNRAGFLFLLPLIVIFIGLLGYSFYFLSVNSFRDVTITFRHTEFTGLANYKTVLTDLKFWRSLLNTFILSAANIFCGLTFGFFIAIVLNFKMKGKRFFHALFFIPSMLPIALMAAVFSSMLEYKNGIINQLLRGVGLDVLAQRWLADPRLAIFSVCSVSVFLIGIPIMYYTADLTTISDSVLEAATMDGAKTRHQLFLVIYPMLKNTHKTIILSMLLGGFREMERVFLMTDGGSGRKNGNYRNLYLSCNEISRFEYWVGMRSGNCRSDRGIFDFLYSAETYRKEWIGGINDEKETGKNAG